MTLFLISLLVKFSFIPQDGEKKSCVRLGAEGLHVKTQYLTPRLENCFLIPSHFCGGATSLAELYSEISSVTVLEPHSFLQDLKPSNSFCEKT